jgi:hypothetical protein
LNWLNTDKGIANSKETYFKSILEQCGFPVQVLSSRVPPSIPPDFAAINKVYENLKVFLPNRFFFNIDNNDKVTIAFSLTNARDPKTIFGKYVDPL